MKHRTPPVDWQLRTKSTHVIEQPDETSDSASSNDTNFPTSCDNRFPTSAMAVRSALHATMVNSPDASNTNGWVPEKQFRKERHYTEAEIDALAGR